MAAGVRRLETLSAHLVRLHRNANKRGLCGQLLLRNMPSKISRLLNPD
jgi:hypothetical protein